MPYRAKISFIAIAAVLGASLTAAPAYAQPNAPAPSPLLTAEGAELITGAGRIADFTTAIGLDPSTLPTVAPENEAKLEAVIQETLARIEPTPPTPAPIDCSDTGALIAQAQSIAAMNKARDPQARSLEQETVYMYFSHYLDLPSPCGYNEPYYPDWITNGDRNAYENFLQVTGNSQLIASTGQVIIAANSLASAPTGAATKVVLENGPKIPGFIDGLDIIGASDSLLTEADNLNSLLSSNQTPEEIVNGVDSRLSSRWGGKEAAFTAVSIVAALMLPATGAVVVSLGAVALSLQITGMNTIVQHAAYNGLRYTTSGRVGARMMRSFGM